MHTGLRASEPADMAALRAAVRAMAIQRSARPAQAADIGADKRKASEPAAPSVRPAPGVRLALEVYRPRRSLGQADRIDVVRAMSAASRNSRAHLLHIYHLGLWDDDTWYPAIAGLWADTGRETADRTVSEHLLLLQTLQERRVDVSPTNYMLADMATRFYGSAHLRLHLSSHVESIDAPLSLYGMPILRDRSMPGMCHAVVLRRLVDATRERWAEWRAAAIAALPLPYSDDEYAGLSHVIVALLHGAQSCLFRRALERAEAGHAQLLAQYALERPIIHAAAHEVNIPLGVWDDTSLYSAANLPMELDEPLASYRRHRRGMLADHKKLYPSIDRPALPSTMPAAVLEGLLRTPRGWRLAFMITAKTNDVDLMPLLERSIAVALAEAEDPDALINARMPKLPRD